METLKLLCVSYCATVLSPPSPPPPVSLFIEWVGGAVKNISSPALKTGGFKAAKHKDLSLFLLENKQKI
jgi:hypothetical protein